MSTRSAAASSAPCEDILLAILEEVPSRTLVSLRSVSRQFSVLVDEVLRIRFLDLTADECNEMVLESCAPYETRACHRQPISFSHFGPATDLPYTGNVAHFKLASDPPVPQFLPLEQDEVFGQNLLSIHLRNAPKRPAVEQDDDEDDIIELSSPPTPPSLVVPHFDYSLSLASSLDRLFRSFWESPSPLIQAASPTESRESSPSPPSTPRETKTHRLACPYDPSSPSALFAAQIECFQVASPSPDSPLSTEDSDGDSLLSYSPLSSSPIPGWRFGGSGAASPPRLFEYYFSGVEMDVGKVVVAAEEGLPNGGRSKTRLAGCGSDTSVVLVL
ncbi:hypothetical protein JCM8097_000156 [Rhodosporidiobolus ruineniae]